MLQFRDGIALQNTETRRKLEIPPVSSLQAKTASIQPTMNTSVDPLLPLDYTLRFGATPRTTQERDQCTRQATVETSPDAFDNRR